MPDINDFLSQLRAVGIIVTREDVLRRHVQASTDWTEAVLQLAFQGRKDGVVFMRSGERQPSVESLQSILRGFPFKGNGAMGFLASIDLRDPESPTFDETEANAAGYDVGVEGRSDPNPYAEGSAQARAFDAGAEQGRSVRRELRDAAIGKMPG